MTARSVAVQGAHYTIYTFGKADRPIESTPWQRHDSVADMKQALQQARGLFDSGRYSRIEIRRRGFDHRANRVTDSTLKVFGAGRRLPLGVPAVLAFASLCGLAAFGLSLYL